MYDSRTRQKMLTLYDYLKVIYVRTQTETFKDLYIQCFF
jgi:hypothetical protein